MDTRNSEYMELLKAELEALASIYKNTVSQKDALAKKDDLLLKRLLCERQIYIDEIADISRKKVEYRGSHRNEGEESMEKSIRLLMRNIELLNTANIRQAEALRSELTAKINHISIGKKAMTNGYFKKMPNRYGCFIDQKVGKR